MTNLPPSPVLPNMRQVVDDYMRVTRRVRLSGWIMAACVVFGLITYGCQTPRPEPIFPVSTPETTFTPTVPPPSVTPPIESATTQATTTADLAMRARNDAAASRPVTVESLGAIVESAQQTVSKLIEARAIAKSNDVLAAQVMGRIDVLETLVHERERQLREQAEASAKREQALQTQLREARDSASAETRKALRDLLIGTVSLGGLLIAGGVAVLFLMPANRSLGVPLMGAGVLVSSLGLTGIYFGRELAFAGLALGVVSGIVGVVWIIKRLKGDTASIIQGVEQAKIANPSLFTDTIKRQLDMATTPGAKAIVREETQ